jgi:hypothetical protein
MFGNNNKYKLVMVIVVLLATGFLATSLASYFVARESLRAKIALNELPLTSDNIYAGIRHDLSRPVFLSALMASDTFLRDWVIDGEIDESQIIKYLKEIQTKYHTFTTFFVSEKSRKYYHADGILKMVSPDEERDRWYFRVREMKADYEINVDPDLANKDAMTIFINYRVFDYDNNYIGATGVGLTVGAVKELIETYQKKYNRTIYFADRSGAIKLAGSNFDPTVQNIAKLEHFQLLKDSVGTQPERSFRYERGGHVIHANIRFVDEFEWYLVIEQPEQETIRQIFTTLLINLGICIVITVVVLVLINLSVTAYQKRIETLRGIVPICSYCKQIRDDKGYWNKVEAYIARHTEAQFSHSICPSCLEEHFPKEYEAIQRKKRAQ